MRKPELIQQRAALKYEGRKRRKKKRKNKRSNKNEREEGGTKSQAGVPPLAIIKLINDAAVPHSTW